MFQHTNIQRGMAVMSYDGVQLGRVIDVTTDGIVVEKGVLSPRDLRVPFSEISTVRGDEIILVRDHASVRQAGMEEREGESSAVAPQHLRQPHEPRTSGPDTEPPTRY